MLKWKTAAVELNVYHLADYKRALLHFPKTTEPKYLQQDVESVPTAFIMGNYPMEVGQQSTLCEYCCSRAVFSTTPAKCWI